MDTLKYCNQINLLYLSNLVTLYAVHQIYVGNMLVLGLLTSGDDAKLIVLLDTSALQYVIVKSSILRDASIWVIGYTVLAS